MPEQKRSAGLMNKLVWLILCVGVVANFYIIAREYGLRPWPMRLIEKVRSKCIIRYVKNGFPPMIVRRDKEHMVPFRGGNYEVGGLSEDEYRVSGPSGACDSYFANLHHKNIFYVGKDRFHRGNTHYPSDYLEVCRQICLDKVGHIGKDSVICGEFTRGV